MTAEMTEDMDIAKTEDGGDLRKLMDRTGQKRGLWYISGALAIAGEALLMIPIFIVYIIAKDYMAGELLQGKVVTLASIASAALLARILLKYLSVVASHILAFRLIYRCRVDISEHIGRLPLGFFNDRGVARIKKAWSEDCETMEAYIAHNVPDLMAGVAMPLITVSVLALVDWRMAVVSFIPIPLALLCASTSLIFSKGRIMERMQGYFSSQAEMYNSITEYMYGMPAVKVFNQTTSSFKRYKESIYAYRNYCNLWTKDMISS